MAALAAYPELSCTGSPFEVQTQWGIFDDVFCAGNEDTFDFLENVLAEVIGLFPSEYIHIGGDECPRLVGNRVRNANIGLRQKGSATKTICKVGSSHASLISCASLVAA